MSYFPIIWLYQIATARQNMLYSPIIGLYQNIIVITNSEIGLRLLQVQKKKLQSHKISSQILTKLLGIVANAGFISKIQQDIVIITLKPENLSLWKMSSTFLHKEKKEGNLQRRNKKRYMGLND